MQRKYLSDLQRRMIASEQGWRCYICHNILEYNYQIDHIIRWSVSKDDSLTNLGALCPNCHSKKTQLEKSNTCVICLKRHSKFFNPCLKKRHNYIINN